MRSPLLNASAYRSASDVALMRSAWALATQAPCQRLCHAAAKAGCEQAFLPIEKTQDRSSGKKCAIGVALWEKVG